MKRRDFVKFIMAAPAARRLRRRFRRFPPLTATISGRVVVPPAAAGSSVYTDFADSWNSMNGTMFSISHLIPWENSGGDWSDKNQTAQGSVPYLSRPCPLGPVTFSGQPMVDLAQRWVTRNTGAFLKPSPSSTSGAFISTRTGTNPPTLSVTAGGVTYNCRCRASTRVFPPGQGTDRSFPNLYAPEVLLTPSQPAYVLIQFDLSAVPFGAVVTAATMTITVVGVGGSLCTANLYEVRTPRIVVDPRTEAGTAPLTGGIAENYQWDVGIANHPDVLFAGDWSPGFSLKWIGRNPTRYPPPPDSAYYTWSNDPSLGATTWPGRPGALPNTKNLYQGNPGGIVNPDPRFGGRASLESTYIKEEDAPLRRMDSYGSDARVRLAMGHNFSANGQPNPRQVWFRMMMIHKGDPPNNQGMKYGQTAWYKGGYLGTDGVWHQSNLIEAGSPARGQWIPQWGFPKTSYPAGTTSAIIAGWPTKGIKILQLYSADDRVYWNDGQHWKIGNFHTRAKVPGYTFAANGFAYADINGEIAITEIEHKDANGNWVPGTGEAWNTSTNVPHAESVDVNRPEYRAMIQVPANFRNGRIGQFSGGSMRTAATCNYGPNSELNARMSGSSILISNAYPGVSGILQTGDKFWLHLQTPEERSYTYTGSNRTSDSAGQFLIPLANISPALVKPIPPLPTGETSEPFDCAAVYARGYLSDPNPLRKFYRLLNYVYDIDHLSFGTSGFEYPVGDPVVGYPVFAQNKVYCVEIGVEMNSVIGPFDAYGNGQGQRDGRLIMEVDGVRFMNKTDCYWTNHPEQGFQVCGYDSTLGGRENPRCIFMHGRVDGPYVCATRRVGPPAMASTLPAWRQTMTTSYAVYNVSAQGETCLAKYSTHPTYPTYPNSVYPELPANGAMNANTATLAMVSWGGGCISEEMGTHGTLLTGGNGHDWGSGTLIFPFDLGTATWGFPVLNDPTKEYFAATMANPNPPAGTEIFFDPNFTTLQGLGHRPGYLVGQPPPPASGTVNWHDNINSYIDHHNLFTHLNYNVAPSDGFNFQNGEYLPNVGIGLRYGTMTVIPNAGGGEAAGTIYISPNLFGHTAAGWAEARGHRVGLTSKNWLVHTTNSDHDFANPFAGQTSRNSAYSEKYKKVYTVAGGRVSAMQVYDAATNALSMVTGLSVHDGAVQVTGGVAVITNGLSGAHLMIVRGFNIRNWKTYLLVIDLDAVVAGNLANSIYTICPASDSGMSPHALPILTGTLTVDDAPWVAQGISGTACFHHAWAKSRKTLVIYQAFGVNPATQLWTNQTSNPYTGSPVTPDSRTLHTIAVPETNWKTTSWVSTQRPLSLGGGCKGLYSSPAASTNAYGRFTWSEKADCCLLIQGNQEPVQAITLG